LNGNKGLTFLHPAYENDRDTLLDFNVFSVLRLSWLWHTTFFSGSIKANFQGQNSYLLCQKWLLFVLYGAREICLSTWCEVFWNQIELLR